MENASKALIIAGAILLSILIISLGIMIFSQAQGVVQDSSLSEFEVTQFNQKFQSYAGNNKRGAQINSLINTVIQHNVSSTDTSRKVVLSIKASNWNKPTGSGAKLNENLGEDATIDTNNAQTKQSQVGSALTGKLYKVDCYTNDAGLIDHIIINNATTQTNANP